MNTALIILDAQKIYTNPKSEMSCVDANITIENINRLIEGFAESNNSLILFRHVNKKDGSKLGRMYDYYGEEGEFDFVEGTELVEYDADLMAPSGALEFIKNRYSAFTNKEFAKVLQQRDIRRLVICGFMTNYCCESTARDAHDLDYYVDFIIDATGTPGTDSFDQTDIRSYVREVMDEGFARVMTTEEFISDSQNGLDWEPS
ncbi:cysteine hydrolase family protein [Candidatus Neomarinimicrobiota bacterium]